MACVCGRVRALRYCGACGAHPGCVDVHLLHPMASNSLQSVTLVSVGAAVLTVWPPNAEPRSAATSNNATAAAMVVPWDVVEPLICALRRRERGSRAEGRANAVQLQRRGANCPLPVSLPQQTPAPRAYGSAGLGTLAIARRYPAMVVRSCKVVLPRVMAIKSLQNNGPVEVCQNPPLHAREQSMQIPSLPSEGRSGGP